MNRSNTTVLPKVYGGLTAVLALAAAIVGGIAMGVGFDPAVGYFAPGILTVLMTVLAVLAAVGAIVLPCLTLRASSLPSPRALAAAPVATRCLGLLLALQAGLYGVITLGVHARQADTSAFVLAGAVAAIGSAAYFFFAAGKGAAAHPSISLILGLCPVVWGFAVIADTYFDMTVTMNSPIKLAIQFGFACLMLLMTAELRLHLGEPAPRLAMAIRGMTSFVGIGGGAVLILSIGQLHDAVVLSHGISLLLVGLYALARMIDDAFCPLPLSDGAAVETTAADVAEETIEGAASCEATSCETTSCETTTPGASTTAPLVDDTISTEPPPVTDAADTSADEA